MSEYSLAPELVESIKTFIDVLKNHPGILESPDLGFFREYLLSLGAKIPSKPAASATPESPSGCGDAKSKPPPQETKIDTDDEEPEEPYPDLDEEGVIDADELDANQEMGNPDAAASEEDMDKSNELKMEAVSAFGEGNFEESVSKYTEAIKLNGGSAILFAKRGQVYLQLQKPKACIRDCNRALQINPDSAVAFKFRGRAHRLLGNWVESASDLRQACKIDFDEQADTWLKEVTPNARKLEEWRLRKKRRDEERDIKLRKRRAQERARAHEEAKSSTPFADAEDGGPGMDDFMGKVPGLDKLMSDPEVVELFSDPEVAAAFNDIGQNPMNILKYQSNPKVAKLLAILQKKMGGAAGGFPGMGGMGGAGGMPFGGAGGMPGGMPGGFGGFGGMPGFGSAGQAPPDSTSQGSAEDLD